MASYSAGRIVLFSEGEYSDFGYCGQVVTLCACDFSALADDFRQAFKPKYEGDRPNPNDFVAWLCANQYVAQISCDTLHIGSYGDLGIEV